MKELIQIHNLSFSFGKQQVLAELTANFYASELTVILGRNGSGKSTLFNILSGMERHYQGEVLFGNQDRKHIKWGKNSDFRIGFMTQFHQTTFPFTVFDVVLTGRAAFSRFAPRQVDLDLVAENLRAFGLWHLKDKPYTALSGGERQLVLLCRILVQQPDVLLLDEPTNHLDLHYQVAVMEHLKRLVEAGTTVVSVMHDPNLALLYGDRFYVMQDKKLHGLEEKDPAVLLSTLENTYNVALTDVQHDGRTLIIPKRKRL
ncbi:ABC transporter ATP-binding protein [Sphingobacterium haloxyli]|uniref:ABC transporter ATP-binding protein n=1 Tax=Sphingobacterium haloxyli TaxID=2100533 RepID=A0A2S9J6C4_9SPHI|nr:ABC transporter ATP-binding protein [Sphingobacterium haloxyli]PRD48289.1 ABC transporter ATP-binding protein [Sphingobacterium haloxyli]